MKKIFALVCLVIGGYLLFTGGSAASGRSGITVQPSAAAAVAKTGKSTAADVTRCGWLLNPTPGNFWLDDKDGEWIIGTQGGHQAEGDYPPEYTKSQWVKTNGNYGYGCACIRGTFNSETKEVGAVTKATARPLSACRKDKTLKEPKE